MSTQFYRQSEDGGELGPFSHDELLAAVLLGELTKDDLVRSEGSTLWVGASHVKGLFGAAPVEDTSAEVVSSGDGQSTRTTGSASTANAAQSAYEAQLQALQAGADGDLDTRSDRRGSGGWWQEQVGWEVWLGVALVVAGVLYSVVATPDHVRFPAPQRGAVPGESSYFFFGTGPWSILEYVLLWFDAVLLVGALLFGRRLLSSRRNE